MLNEDSEDSSSDDPDDDVPLTGLEPATDEHALEELIPVGLTWMGWPGPLLADDNPSTRLLEPLPDVGLLQDGVLLAQLSAREIARVFLCTCHTLRNRLANAHAVQLGILQHRKLGGGSALEFSARCRHRWLQTDETTWPSMGARALRWLDSLERAPYLDDFVRPSRQKQHRGFDWYCYGPMRPAEEGSVHRQVEDATSFLEVGIGRPRCLTLRIRGAFPQSATHFGRGVFATLSPTTTSTPFRPRRFSCLLRVRLDRSSTRASVGYLILSDGKQWTPTSQGLFGTEAVFLRVDVRPNSRTPSQSYSSAAARSRPPSQLARLFAVDGAMGIERVLVEELRIGSWVQLTMDFDWEEKAVMLSVDDLAAPSWPDGSSHHERKVRFRGECEALGQLSMLSVMDSEEGCTSVSWTDVVCG